jgi:predicted TIM-barrel fold metal-dependent hydrolase
VHLGSDFPILKFAQSALDGLGELGLSDDVRRLFLHDNVVTALALGKP